MLGMVPTQRGITIQKNEAPLSHGNLYVAPLPANSDANGIRTFFESHHSGAIESIWHQFENNYTFLKCKTIPEAEEAMHRIHGLRCGSTSIGVSPTKNDYVIKWQVALQPPSNRICVMLDYVDGTPNAMSEQTLRLWFQAHGTVSYVKSLTPPKCSGARGPDQSWR